MSSKSIGRERAHAAKAIHAVAFDNRTIDWVMLRRSDWTTTPLEKDLLYGVVRTFPELYNFIHQFLDKPLRDKDRDITCLLLVGAYQLNFSSTKVHAIINESVAAADRLHKKWAKGLINAVLRNAKRKLESGDLGPSDDESEQDKTDQSDGKLPHVCNHPIWLVESLNTQLKGHTKALLEANNKRAPMSLRVNTMKNSRQAYEASLTEQSIGFRQGAPQDSLILDRAIPSISLPGWSQGNVAVQDCAAQYATELLLSSDTKPKTILDACAAPGGKLSHLIESTATSGCVIDAIDISSHRIEQTQEILKRLGHNQTIQVADASIDSWWSGEPYSHILLDAPCSGTGTLRRHPDIKLLLAEESIQEHADLQLQILNNLWRMLSPGGTLLYCTCSLLAAENDSVIEQFLYHQKNNANVLEIKLPTGAATQHGWQLSPTDPDTDGFYYALLSKVSATGAT